MVALDLNLGKFQLGRVSVLNAPAIYLVRFWIKPGSEKVVLDWLDGGHLGDVVEQPGFRWAQRFQLVEPDADGWSSHCMVYGLDSLDALYNYIESEATRRFAGERESLGLDPLLKMDRNWGTLEMACSAQASSSRD